MHWILMLLLLCICPPALAEETGGYALTASGTGTVNLMAEPNADGTYLSSYDSGVWVSVFESEGNWLKVEMPDGMRGYLPVSDVQTVHISNHLFGIVQNPNDREFLNLREEPNLQANILGTYYNGVPCLILSHEEDGWYHVRVDGTEGYFREEFIRETNLPYGEKLATVHSNSRSGANMRSGPGYKYPASRLCSEGRYLTVIQKGADWWLVSDEGNVGFLRSDALYEGILNPVFQDASVTGATAVVRNPKQTQVLNMREKPTRFSSSLAQYSNGTRFTLLQQGTQWCRVSDNNGNTGWCMTEFLALEGAPAVPTRTVTHAEETYVNMRAAPSAIAGTVIAQVPHGTEVVVLIPDCDEWTLIEYDGLAGYMFSSYLK